MNMSRAACLSTLASRPPRGREQLHAGEQRDQWAPIRLIEFNRVYRRFGANWGLVGGPLPIIDEPHGERLAGHAVSKRLRER